MHTTNRLTVLAKDVLGLFLASLALLTQPTFSQAEDTKETKIGPVVYPVPATWKEQAPPNTMRLKQFGIPLAEADQGKGKAELIVFYFGQGQGGMAKLNVERWIAMFPVKEGEPKTNEFTANGLKITTVDVTGTYNDKPPFAQSGVMRENFRMLAAVVEVAPNDSYFFRLTGPKETIGVNAAGFEAMLRGAQPAK